jgi:hypothetical protein
MCHLLINTDRLSVLELNQQPRDPLILMKKKKLFRSLKVIERSLLMLLIHFVVMRTLSIDLFLLSVKLMKSTLKCNLVLLM